VALALALFVGATALADDTKAEKGDTHDGTVVSVTECKLADLKAGQKVRVTFKKGEIETAIRVEALNKNDKFEKRDDKNGDKSKG
jgi:hypothetical protein